jgi:hypothetical protein
MPVISNEVAQSCQQLGGLQPSHVCGVERNGLALLLAFCLDALHDLSTQPGPARLPQSGT